jgi:FKBP-type peptidyl-prolyl cis-trans isomerase FkpA
MLATLRCLPQSACAGRSGAAAARVPGPGPVGRVALAAVLVAGMAAGCTGEATVDEPADAGAGETPVDLTTIAYAPELDIRPDSMTATAEGILLQEVRTGRGPVAGPGTRVAVEYRGWLPDGTLFEERPSPDGFGASEFVVGDSPPVAGFDGILTGMRAGGVRRAVLPPDQGYGLVGRPAGVPAGAVLVFEIRLLRIAR